MTCAEGRSICSTAAGSLSSAGSLNWPAMNAGTVPIMNGVRVNASESTGAPVTDPSVPFTVSDVMFVPAVNAACAMMPASRSA